MGIYGKMEVQYFQLTPIGRTRVQSGKYPARVHPATRKMLKRMADFGGVVEWDELKMGAGANPQILGVSLKRAIDLGYVAPATVTPQ